MSLYNMVNGYNPSVFLILPMLGKQRGEYPRFRDCFINDDGNILVYTRVGGGNRECGYGEEKLYDNPNFIKTYDDEYDTTYGYYEFSVPEKWKKDFEIIINNGIRQASIEYIEYLIKFYNKEPNIAKQFMEILEIKMKETYRNKGDINE